MVLDPGASVVVPGTPAAKLDASAPVTANGAVSVTGVSTRLVMVTVRVLVVSCATEPKSRLAGATAKTRLCGVLGVVSWKSALLSSVSWSVGDAAPGLRS